MKKKSLSTSLIIILSFSLFYLSKINSKDEERSYLVTSEGLVKPKKIKNARNLYAKEREKYEFDMQKNPITNIIPKEEKQRELENSLSLRNDKLFARKSLNTSNTYISRGPSNLGGRTRAFAIDLSDNTSNTMLSGGVSSGLFRSINGGSSWDRVSSLDEIHNVTTIAQDPRTGFQNKWYYGTGEWTGNSASSNGAPFRGRGIWESSDSGLTWNQIAETNSSFTNFDSFFDYVNKVQVHPITGELFIATTGKLFRYDGTNMNIEIEMPNNGLGWTDVVINSSGRVFVALEGDSDTSGVWTSPTGTGSWVRIAEQDSPTGWDHSGRIVLACAPSNDNILYALYNNGNSGNIEADLWQYNLGNDSWTNLSFRLPDEAGGDSPGNDPFAIQRGYDLVVSVKPDDENFVVIGGTNAYRISNIINESTFTRIGGYKNNEGYSLYDEGGVDHHPDIHVLKFDPNNTDVLFTGTDGGVHKTTDINASSIVWENLNNNYTTYQYYHVDIDPLPGSNIVLGGAQDNGTTLGGTNVGQPNNSTMEGVLGGDGVAVGLTRREDNTQIQFFYGFQLGRIFTNYPSFREVTPTGAPTGDDSNIFVTYFYLDPDNVENLFYAGNNKIYKTDKTASLTSDDWVDLGELSTGELVRSFATTRGIYTSSSYLLIGGGNGGVFKLLNPKAATNLNTILDITPSNASKQNGSLVVGLAVHPTNSDIAMAVYSNYGVPSIFITKNANFPRVSWTLVERNLEAHSIRSAAIAQVDEETIYFVGTARGLYSSKDPENEDWQLEGENTIGLSVVSSLVYRPEDKTLLVGTHGNGMFETTVQGTLSTNDFISKNTISVYPNPAMNDLFVNATNLDLNNEFKYSISDISGKTVQKGTLGQSRIELAEIQSGVYILSVKSNNRTYSTKFIKQ